MHQLEFYINKSIVSESARKLWLAQFIDDFTKEKDLSKITLKDNKVEPITQLFVATAHQLCLDLKLPTPDWIKEIKILPEPFFASNMTRSCFIALRDSLYCYKIRNIFVPHNFLSRC